MTARILPFRRDPETDPERRKPAVDPAIVARFEAVFGMPWPPSNILTTDEPKPGA